MSVTNQALTVGRAVVGCAAAKSSSAGSTARTTSGRGVRPALRDGFLRLRRLSGLLRALARRPAGASTTLVFSESTRYFTAVINTVIYVGVGVNLKMGLAFLLSGFFMRKRWWIKALLGGLHPALGNARPLPAYMSIHWFMNGQWGMLRTMCCIPRCSASMGRST